jgi:hypothetical protein
MQVVFETLMDMYIIPFFKASGFETKDINSETNKTLGIKSQYFYRIEGDLNSNFYFESNSDNTTEKYEFKLDFGIYSATLHQTIGLPLNDAPNGLGNTFYLASEEIFPDKSYWQSITKKADIDAFATTLLGVLKSTLDAHKTVDGVDTLMSFCINQKSNAYNYNYIIRYLKITDKKELLDKYVAALRTADGSPLPDWMMHDVTALLDTTILKQKVINNFTTGIKVPKSWEIVLDWSEKNVGKVIGGHFEIIENSNNMLKHVVNMGEKAAKQLAVIGENGSSEVFCLWQRDRKNAPVVMLGEAGSARVIAENMDDFIQLLAVGYYEIEVADYDAEPIFPEGAEHWKNSEFRAFYTKKFKKNVPKTGAEIVARITTKDDVFFNWLCDNDDNWKQWRR